MLSCQPRVYPVDSNRRSFLILGSSTVGSVILTGCGSTGSPAETAPAPAPTPTPAPTPSPPVRVLSPEMTVLQSYLRANAMAGFGLPAPAAVLPSINWAGALSSATAATSLPNGVVIPVTSNAISKPAASHWAATLPGDPRVNGYACYQLVRNYSCKNQARSGASLNVFRLRTDSPVVEFSGVLAEGGQTVQTLLVDGRLVPPRVLSASRGQGGWAVGTIRIDFGTRAVRDIWIETGLNTAFFKVAAEDVVSPLDDLTQPQMTVIGDSYLQSRSSSFGNGGAIALETALRLGLRRVTADAIGGTGYWNSGGNLGNLNDRLAADAADDSSLYLVMAGINDYGDVISPPQLVWPARSVYEQAVTGYFASLRAAQPTALIVATSPFCPIPSLSDSTYVANPPTNDSGKGDNLYKAELHKKALQAIAGPWVYIDVLMGGGWLNSSGATGDITNLQWFTGGTATPDTTATNKPGNTHGGGGGGFGGIASIPVVQGGRYTQAPDIVASGGTGTGLLLASTLDSAGAIRSVSIVSCGSGYTAAAGLPSLRIDSAFETMPATLGTPQLMAGINPNGQYPLASFAPAGAADLNNIYVMLMPDTIHPSPVGVDYVSSRLARNIHDAVMAL